MCVFSVPQRSLACGCLFWGTNATSTLTSGKNWQRSWFDDLLHVAFYPIKWKLRCRENLLSLRSIGAHLNRPKRAFVSAAFLKGTNNSLPGSIQQDMDNIRSWTHFRDDNRMRWCNNTGAMVEIGLQLEPRVWSRGRLSLSKFHTWIFHTTWAIMSSIPFQKRFRNIIFGGWASDRIKVVGHSRYQAETPTLPKQPRTPRHGTPQTLWRL
jgi:hypothetical protein